MKKIITLLFFVGFLTSAFAQTDRRQQYSNQTNDNRSQSTKYSGDHNYGDSKSYAGNDAYHQNDQWNKHNNEKEYGYKNDRDERYGDNMRRNYYTHPQYDNQKRNEDYSYRTKVRIPLGRILFGASSLF